MNPCPLTIVIFGASGDLTARKLMPSLYRLARKNKLPEETRIVGVSRTAFSDDAFRDKMAAALREFIAEDWDEAAWKAFRRAYPISRGTPRNPAVWRGCRDRLQQAEGATGGRCLFYLAVSPTLYPGIITQLGA